MALTYEDKNCASAGGFDSTAVAILRGVADYLNIASTLTSFPIALALPDETELLQNYPNPFNPSTTIGYNLARQEFVSLKVFDLLGREVATLVKEFEKPGYKSVVWDASNVPSGVYFYQLKAGQFVTTRRLSVIK